MLRRLLNSQSFDLNTPRPVEDHEIAARSRDDSRVQALQRQILLLTGFAATATVAAAGLVTMVSGLPLPVAGVGATAALTALWMLAARTTRIANRTLAPERADAETRLNQVLKALPDGIAIWDSDDNLLTANGRYQDIAPRIAAAIQPGRSFEDLMETDIDGGYVPAGAERRWRELRQLQRLGDERTLRRELDGRQYRFEEIDADDGLSLTLVSDVTDIAVRETELRDSDERYKLAQAAANEGLWDIDLRTGAFFASARLSGFIGCPPSVDVTPAMWLRSIHRADFRQYREAWRSHLRGELPLLNVEYRVSDGRNGYRWVGDRAIALRDASGQVYRIAGSVIDLTAQKKTETALRTARQLAEQASLAKSEFLAGISHELRTPLNAVIGFSKLIRDGEPNAAELTEYADLVYQSGIRLDDAINDLMDIARADSGRLTLLESTFDPVACLRAAIRMTDTVAQERRVALNLDLPRELPLLLADEAKVKKMIRNLAVVAIKTAPAGTSVDVAVRWAPSIGLTIDVADSGAPIEAGLLERALDPLHHSNPNPTRKVEGFGIELAVVKAFADLHGVHLQMRPGDEIGNRATVIFPPERLH